MLVVVGGHSRNIGKTSVMCGIIRRLKAHNWTALKITQYGSGPCGHSDHACECAPDGDSPFALTEEYEKNKTDSGRYLAAGAERSFWLRTPAGRLFEAADLVRKIVDKSQNCIIESNSILEYFDPDVFLMVMDFGCEDFKASSLQFMDQADGFVVIDKGINAPLWDAVASGLWDQKPQFPVKPPVYVTAAITDFIKAKMPAGAPAA
jgi:hypothetical protein